MTTSATLPLPDVGTLHRLQHWIAGRWLAADDGAPISSAVLDREVARLPLLPAPMEEALHTARTQGRSSLVQLDFARRGQILRALAKYLLEHKEVLYAWSFHTGATRKDSWIDIEGGIATLSAYAALAASELPSGRVLHEGPPLALGKQGRWMGSHILVPRDGVAVHINAFNFPVWGLLEKFAPCFLAGMPCLAKPASATAYLCEIMVRLIDASGVLPPGSLQLVLGRTGDLLDRLREGDVVTFTGSADTALQLRSHPNVLRRSVVFNAEADSLNCAILGPEVEPDQPEWDLMVREVVREITVKAGQKCTAIRRIMVPRRHLEAMTQALCARLAAVQVGDTRLGEVTMGALASAAQREDLLHQIERLREDCELILDPAQGKAPLGEGLNLAAMMAPALMRCAHPDAAASLHAVEAFGPVSTLMPYEDLDHAIALAARGCGSLVASLYSHDTHHAAYAVSAMAAWHGRIAVIDRDAASESTGHGSPLPMLKHGGPGRAGGGEELGGLRAVKSYMQRAAVQASPRILSAITGEYVRGTPPIESGIHPFRRSFEDLQVGHSLLTHRRTVTEADIVAFGGLSGDFFYMHFDDEAAKASAFGQRIAHGYFVLSAAAGLFVHPAPGPVLANYGLDTLRFVKPVAIGDTIQARLTCKRKIDKAGRKPGEPAQGVVAWDVQVSNQHGELVASYDILTLVSKKDQPSPAQHTPPGSTP